ncbi:MAG: MBL fold metallo-hydrolase [Bacteroidales bacterium]|jgi:phosphoribosyl 1,2-cyclic phosphate phosphodiesterase|nr:MBL fold metallo-hydrolase [Bacteroidales bacterium]
MKITFLGTGTSQGIPVIACQCKVCQSKDSRDKRLRSALAIETDDYRIIVDCGPDFRQQMLREKINSIDAILITHGHKDHLGGLDDVRAFNYILKRPAHVYATSEVRKIIKMEFSYAFEKNPYPGVPEIVLHPFHNKTFLIDGLKVIPIKAFHYNDSNYVFGFRIHDFTYITDAVKIEEREKEKIKGSKIIVLNALRKQTHYSHFNLDEALALMYELRPETGLLTHISHQMGLHGEVERDLPSFVHLAYDGLTMTF